MKIISFFKKREKNYVKYLASKGIEIGEHTVFFNPSSNVVDIQRPWMLKIGDYCKITHGVIILSHDYSRSVIRRVYGDIVDSSRKTIIGDNVFIGMNSIILMGTKIGNNVIIGAGSVVTGTIPDNCVVAGNPAKIICSLEEFYYKKKEKCSTDAENCAYEFYNKYGRMPNINEMGAFFPLYLNRTREDLKKNNLRTNLSGDEEEDIIKCFLNSNKHYKSFDDFIDIVKERLGKNENKN